MLYLSFGVLCGLASGFSYNAVMSSISRWFPDKQGLISGILLMGFGIGAFLIGKLYQAFTPDTTGAWRTSFLVLGGAIFVVFSTVRMADLPSDRTVHRSRREKSRGFSKSFPPRIC